jgi:hypothetical protein
MRWLDNHGASIARFVSCRIFHGDHNLIKAKRGTGIGNADGSSFIQIGIFAPAKNPTSEKTLELMLDAKVEIMSLRQKCFRNLRSRGNQD